MKETGTILHYVHIGERVEYSYTTAVYIEATRRGCNVIQTIETSKAENDCDKFNAVVDWLIENAPDEFILMDELIKEK